MHRLIITLLLLIPTIAFADDRYIGVTGNGIYEVAPEVAEITFYAVALDHDPVKAKSDVDEITKNLIQGISPQQEHVKLKAGKLSIREDKNYKTGEVNGNLASRKIEITISKLSKLDSIIDLALSSGVKRVSEVEFAVLDVIAAKKEARKLASDDAKTKAEDYASNLNLKLGSIITVQDSTYPDREKPRPIRAMLADSYAPDFEEEILVPEKIEYQEYLFVKYQIK